MNIAPTLEPNGVKLLNRPAAKVHSLLKLHAKSVISNQKLERQHRAFFANFPDNKGKYLTFGLGCLAVIVFDFFLSRQTMDWLAVLTDAPVEMIAVIFTLIDGVAAVSLSGCFAKDAIGKALAYTQWSRILWSLFSIKAILFIINIAIVNVNTGDYSLLTAALMVGLIFLVYGVLHYAGEGLGYIVGSAGFGVWKFWAGNPSSYARQVKDAYTKFDAKISVGKIDPVAAYTNFGIQPLDGNSLLIQAESQETTENISPLYNN